jgi:hypothetical protein
MAAVIISKLIKESSCIEDDNGLTIIDVYQVGQLSGSNILVDARGAPGLPVYGLAHDAEPSVVCRNINVRPFLESHTEARVLCTFKPPDFSSALSPVIRFTGTTKHFTTVHDATGKLILINYTPAGGTAVRPQIGELEGERAVGLLEIERIETGIPTFALRYTNAISTAPFQGQRAGLWLCRDVSFEKELYRSGYRVRYLLEFDSFGFIKPAFYRDVNGFLPSDAAVVPLTTLTDGQTGNGWTAARISGAADLNALNLPVVFG